MWLKYYSFQADVKMLGNRLVGKSRSLWEYGDFKLILQKILDMEDIGYIIRKMFRALDSTCSSRIENDDWMNAVRDTFPWMSERAASDAFDIHCSGITSMTSSEFRYVLQ